MEPAGLEGKRLRLSLGKRIRHCREFACWGVKPNWDDYPIAVREAIWEAEQVFYPSHLYESLFQSFGKTTFPRNYYAFLGNKVRQTSLFQLLEIPHPRTRVYYGRDRLTRIRADFSYPFIAKAPVGSSMGEGVFLIQGEDDLADYLHRYCPAYIQEYLPLERDLRVVLIKARIIHAYWRIHRPGEFRNNVAQGGAISFDEIPEAALAFAVEVAVRCGFEEVGLDICEAHGSYCVLEANMVFGLEGFRQKGLDLHQIFGDLERQGLL